MSVRLRIVPAPRQDPADAASRHDQAVPDRPERRGQGRPAIGGTVRQELGEDLKALVETWALGTGNSRAAAVRILLRRAVEQEMNPAARTVVVEGDDLRVLLVQLRGAHVRRVRFVFDAGLKTQINDEQWTTPLGNLEYSALPQEKGLKP